MSDVFSSDEIDTACWLIWNGVLTEAEVAGYSDKELEEWRIQYDGDDYPEL